MENIFNKIYTENLWGNSESKSGPGSSFLETQLIGPQLKRIIKQYDIKTMLDVPCGDFNWMSHLVNHLGCKYTGGDIVSEIISENSIRYPNVQFQKIDLTSLSSSADLIFCRDCLVHFPFAFIHKTIESLKKTQSKYFMTTHFPANPFNADIPIGHWRPLNLCQSPFNWPQPIDIIVEGFYQKALGIWEIQSLK